jgi:hypothetical protein
MSLVAILLVLLTQMSAACIAAAASRRRGCDSGVQGMSPKSPNDCSAHCLRLS